MKNHTKTEINKLVNAGVVALTRVYPALYLDVKKEGVARWVYRFQINNHRSQMTIGTFSNTNVELMSYDDAIKKAIDYNSMVANGDNPKLDQSRKKFHSIKTVNDLADLYIEQKSQKIKSINIPIRLYKKEIKPYIGHILLDKIHPFDIFELVQKVVKSGRPSIATQSLYLCKNIFKLGVKCQLITSNPAVNYTAKEDAGGCPLPRDVYLLIDDIEKMFTVFRQYPRKVPEQTYIGITLLLILGMRKMELFSARWSDVCLETKFFQIYADNTKSQKSLAVTIRDQIIPLFERLKVLSGRSDHLFPNRRKSTRPFISDDTVNHTLADLFGKVINTKKTSENVLGKAGVPEFTIHDLRRTFRTLLAELGVSKEVAEKCLNHADSILVRTYNRYEYKKERRLAHEMLADLILPLAFPKN
ncbi:MAG: site-specific integrase [Alteromonadaceae bacterium]